MCNVFLKKLNLISKSIAIFVLNWNLFNKQQATNHKKEADDVGKLGKKQKQNRKPIDVSLIQFLKVEDDDQRKPLQKHYL